jgi:hypothetical protein
MKSTFALLVAFVFAVAAAAQTRNLEIYWIDVEGGASTLFVSPTGESLLFDTGFPGNGDRDAKRIHAAAQSAGLRQIDHVVISHWHADHEGGLNALSKMIPLGKFYDHGNGVEQSDRERLEDYKAIAGNKRTIVKPGDTIPFGPVQVRVLVSEGPVITNPINGGGPNPFCANHQQMEAAPPENQRVHFLDGRSPSQITRVFGCGRMRHHSGSICTASNYQRSKQRADILRVLQHPERL